MHTPEASLPEEMPVVKFAGDMPNAILTGSICSHKGDMVVVEV